MNVPEELLVVTSDLVLVYKVTNWELSNKVPLNQAEKIRVVDLEDAFHLAGIVNGSEVFIDPSTGIQYDLHNTTMLKATPINQMTGFNFVLGDSYYSMSKFFKKRHSAKVPANALFVSRHVFVSERGRIIRSDDTTEGHFSLEASIAVAKLALLFKMSFQKFIIESLVADEEPEVVNMFFKTYKTHLAAKGQPLMPAIHRILTLLPNAKAVMFILSLGEEFDQLFASAVDDANFKLKAPEILHLLKLMNDTGKSSLINEVTPKLLRIYPSLAKDLHSSSHPDNIPHLEKLLESCKSTMPQSVEQLSLLNDIGIGNIFTEASLRLGIVEDLIRYYFTTLGRMNKQFCRAATGISSSKKSTNDGSRSTELLNRKHTLSEMIKAQLELTAEQLKDSEETVVGLCLNAVSKMKAEKAEQEENNKKLEKTIVDLQAVLRQKMEQMNEEGSNHEPIATVPEPTIKITGNSAREVISSIQSEYNNIIAHHTAQRMLKNALEKLADDIYSSNIRFIYELVQNADDATFAEGEIPTVRIELAGNEVLFSSNEIGFTAREVQALCDIGGSTKSSSQKIGKKGIGFKSVFKVSNRPTVFSGDYTFYFDALKPLGYIYPNWLENENHDRSWTQFKLPLKTDIDLAKEFGDLETQLQLTMLFLKQVRRIEFTHNGITSVFTKDSMNEEETIHFSDESKRYLQISHSARVPPKFVAAKGETSTISICFPVASTEANFPAFVYLPVENNVGFNFAINADLDLVSSREQVHSSSLWNIWLQDEIAHTFALAIEKFKLQERILELLPNLNRIHNTYWIATAVKMREIIKKSTCFVGMSGKTFPIADLLLPVGGIENLIDSEVVLSALKKDFLHVKSISTEALTDFGFEPFDMKHLVKCMTNDYVAEKSDEWFNNVHLWIDKRFDAVSHGSILFAASIWKLTNGRVTSLEQGPLSYGIDSSLPIECLTLRIISTIGSDVPSFWKHFDVKKMDKKDVFEQLRSIHFQLPSSEHTLWDHLRIIKALNLITELNNPANRGMLWFPCTVDTKLEWRKNDCLYYPTTHLKALFVNQAVSFMNEPPEDMQTAEWNTFFKQIGVHFGPRVLSISSNQSAMCDEIMAVLNEPGATVIEQLLRSLDAQWKFYSEKEAKEISVKVKTLCLVVNSKSHTISKSLLAQVYRPLFGAELNLPYFPYDDLNRSLMVSLDVCCEVNALGLLSVWEHLSANEVKDFQVWKKLFEMMQSVEFSTEEPLPPKIYIDKYGVVPLEKCLWTVPNSLKLYRYALNETYAFKELFVDKLKLKEKPDFDVYRAIIQHLNDSNDQEAGAKSLRVLLAMNEDEEWTCSGNNRRQQPFYLPNTKFALIEKQVMIAQIPNELKPMYGWIVPAKEIPPALFPRLGVRCYADIASVKILTSEEPVLNNAITERFKNYCRSRAQELQKLLEGQTTEYINSLQVVMCKSIIKVLNARQFQRCMAPAIALYDNNVIVITHPNASLEKMMKELRFCLRNKFMLKATGAVLTPSNASHKKILEEMKKSKRFNASLFNCSKTVPLSSLSKFVWEHDDNSLQHDSSPLGPLIGSRNIEEPLSIDFVPDPVYGREREQFVFEQLIIADYKTRYTNVHKVVLSKAAFKIEFTAQNKKEKEVHTVTWTNANGEAGLPYDLTIQYSVKKSNTNSNRNNNTNNNNNNVKNNNVKVTLVQVTRYIEVKATKSVPPASFVISKNEFNKSLVEGQSYTYWLVFGDNSYKKYTKDQLDHLNYKVVVQNV